MIYIYTKEVITNKLEIEIRGSSITKALDFITLLGNTLSIYFKDTLSSEEEVTLNNLVEAHDLTPLPEDATKVVLEGVTLLPTERALKVANTTLEGSSTLLVSHNFCDKTTWYSESVRVNSEILTSNGLVYTSSQTNWIDLEHGKVPYEHRMASSYKPIIKVAGLPIATGYTIDYASGSVSFTEIPTGEVSADYSYATTSGWTVAPSAGKILKIIGTEVKFTEDAYLTYETAIQFQVYVGTYAYGSPTIYNNMEDVIKCSMGMTSVIPSFDNWPKKVIVLPFNYITSKDLISSQGTKIKISLRNGTPIPGTFGIVTVHCISIDE